MSRPSTALLIALAACLVSQPTAAQQLASVDSGGNIATSGSAQLTLQPTHAVITFAVETRAVTAGQAAALNGPKTRRLLDALARSRPAPDSVLVIGVSVGPNENQQRGTVVGYQARAELRVVVSTLDSLGLYLDVALKNGATEVNDVSYTSDSAAAADQKALGLAFAQAYGKAQALAQAAGGSLGPLKYLSTGSDYGYGRASAVVASAASGVIPFSSAVPLSAQGVTVTASVSATWRFVPHR